VNDRPVVVPVKFNVPPAIVADNVTVVDDGFDLI
jgi:hypothetical protein